MTHFIVRVIVNAIAIGVAAFFNLGISITSNPIVTILFVAVIFGLLNAIIKPILSLLACPLYIITLGLFTFVMNAIMLWLTAWIAGYFGLGFEVNGFIGALLGAFVISVISFLLSLLPGL